ncbi:hypothetical protein NTH44_003593 [Vibrio metoecus]
MITILPSEDKSLNKPNTNSRTLFLIEQIGSEGFVSKMDIDSEGNIGSSIVINPSELIERMYEAQSNNNSHSKSLLDERILVKNCDELVWYYKPEDKQRFFYRHEGRTINAPIKWPTFIFRKTGNELKVGVIQHNKRPTLTTRIYYAPLPNVYDSGKICLGSCTLPNTFDVDEISKAYFNSVKTHINNKKMLRAFKMISQEDYFQFISKKKTEPVRVSELTVYGTVKQFIQ